MQHPDAISLFTRFYDKRTREYIESDLFDASIKGIYQRIPKWYRIEHPSPVRVTYFYICQKNDIHNLFFSASVMNRKLEQ